MIKIEYEEVSVNPCVNFEFVGASFPLLQQPRYFGNGKDQNRKSVSNQLKYHCSQTNLFGSKNTRSRQTGRPFVMTLDYLSEFLTRSACQSVFLLKPCSDRVDATVAEIDGSQ